MMKEFQHLQFPYMPSNSMYAPEKGTQHGFPIGRMGQPPPLPLCLRVPTGLASC